MDRITDLIENLLDVSRINAGKLGFKIEPFEVSEVLEHCVGKLRDELKETNSTMDLNVKNTSKQNYDRKR